MQRPVYREEQERNDGIRQNGGIRGAEPPPYDAPYELFPSAAMLEAVPYRRLLQSWISGSVD
jgi:hypothetical protein